MRVLQKNIIILHLLVDSTFHICVLCFVLIFANIYFYSYYEKVLVLFNSFLNTIFSI